MTKWHPVCESPNVALHNHSPYPTQPGNYPRNTHARTHARTHTHAHTHTHTHTRAFNGPFSRTTQVSRYQRGITNLDFTEARDSGISWAICKSAPCSRQITTPAPHHTVFLQAGCPSCHPTNQSKHTHTHTHTRLTALCPGLAG